MSPSPTEDALWAAVSSEERTCGCLALLSSREAVLSEPRKDLFRELAHEKRFREKFFQQRKPEENLQYLLGGLQAGGLLSYRRHVIKAFLLERHRTLLRAFLDSAGIPHANGLVDADAAVPEGAAFAEAIRTVQRGTEPRVLGVYLGYLLVHGGDFWQHLADAIGTIGLDLPALLAFGRPPPDRTASEADHTTASTTSLDATGKPSPSSDEFTTLDNWLIRTAVASAFGESGALSADQLEDLIEGVIELNAQRQHSLFHRGFLHALQDRSFAFRFPGENEERRSWYFTGAVLGLLRSNREPDVLQLLAREANLASKICTNRRLRCGPMLLPHIYPLLRGAGEYPGALRWLESQLDRLPPQRQMDFLTQATGEAASHLRRGQWAEAEALLDALLRFVTRRMPEHIHGFFLPEIQRRKAQVLQLKGDFANAESLLAGLAVDRDVQERGNILCDLALVMARFRSIAMVLPSRDKATARTMAAALEAVRAPLEEAIREHPETSANAHFCVGVLGFLSIGSPGTIAGQLQTALAGMHRKEQAYTETELLPWARFLLGISLLETAEPANFSYARELINQSVQSPVAFPLWLWHRALEAATLFDDLSVGASIAEHLRTKRGNDAWESIWRTGLIRQIPSLRCLYLKWLEDARMSIGLKWERTRDLLPVLLRESPGEDAPRALDILEEIADSEPSYAESLQDLLKDDANYSPAWTPDEARDVRIRLLESIGRLDEAAILVERRFHRICQIDDPRCTAEARELLEWLQRLGVSHDHLDRLQARLAPTASDTSTDPMQEGPEIRVLYVGGNETQMAYEAWLRAEFSVRYPRLQITFYFPEWSSRWNVHLQRLEPMIGSSHVVVLNQLVRTQLGRHVRALCDSDRPWFPCTGRGRDSLFRSIKEAALWANQKLTKASSSE